jgi:molybdate transport system substrate-binding protein
MTNNWKMKKGGNMPRVAINLAVGLILPLLLAGTAQAAEIHAIVTGALTAPFRQIVPAFERATGHKLVIAWGPSSGDSKDAIPVRLRNSEPADVVIMIGTAFDGLVRQGVFKTAMRTDVAQSGIGVGVRVGAPRPDVSSADTLKRTLLDARSIGYSEGGSGVYVSTELLKRLGIADQLAPKMKLVTGELVGEAVARGDVGIGIQQISELRAVKGVDYLGPLPDGLQLAAVITAAVSQNAKEAEAARTFVSFLTSPESTKAFTDGGLTVPPSH